MCNILSSVNLKMELESPTVEVGSLGCFSLLSLTKKAGSAREHKFLGNPALDAGSFGGFISLLDRGYDLGMRHYQHSSMELEYCVSCNMMESPLPRILPTAPITSYEKS